MGERMISNGMAFIYNPLKSFRVFFNLFSDTEKGCFYLVFFKQV